MLHRDFFVPFHSASASRSVRILTFARRRACWHEIEHVLDVEVRCTVLWCTAHGRDIAHECKQYATDLPG